MTGLAQQQQALLDALFAWPNDVATENIATYAHGTWARGLKSYQSHGHMLAQRTLQAAYPVLAQLLGADSFAALARAFWHGHPPGCGDLAQWGGELADFVRASDQLQDEPYLDDVARVEWALHICAGAADRAPEPATFERLVTQDPAAVRLVLAPGCAVVHSAWPVVSIVTAHQQAGARALGGGKSARQGPAHPSAEPTPALAAASAKLRDGVAEAAVVWRVGYQPHVRAAVPGEAPLLAALLAGRSLDEAVQSAVMSDLSSDVHRDVHGAVKSDMTNAGELDFNAWLPMAVQTGLLLGAALLEGDAQERGRERDAQR